MNATIKTTVRGARSTGISIYRY